MPPGQTHKSPFVEVFDSGKRYVFYCTAGGALYWDVKIMRSIAMFLLTINPTFIPHRFAIWDFNLGFKVFCQFNKNR